MQCSLAHAHDIVDLNTLACRRRQSEECPGLHLLGVADDMIDFGHAGKTLGLDLRRASRHDDACRGPLAAESANGLRGLSNCFTRYCARIDDDSLIKSRLAGVTAHDLGLIGIEPATKRYHFGFGHKRNRLLSERRPHNLARRTALDRHFRQFGKIDCALVFKLDGARHEDVIVGRPLDTENAAGKVTSTLRSVSRFLAAQTVAAHAADPQAKVKPAPRSQVLRTIVVGDVT